MKPIFFPFTRISEPMQNALFACFDQIIVYSPHPEFVPASHRDLAAKGRIELRLPKEESDDDLPILLTYYQEWAKLHRGERPDFHKFGSRYAVAPQDPSRAEIRSQILKTDQNTSPGEDNAADLLLKARLFLVIAQQYDEQQESLSKDLCIISDMQQNLLQNLSPDREEAPFIKSEGLHSESADILRPMTTERLAAWSRIYTHHQRQAAERDAPHKQISPFLVTSDPEAFDLLKGSGENMESVCSISDIPVAGEGLSPDSLSVKEKIHQTLRSASEGSPLSGTVEFSLSENRHRFENAAELTIYRKKGDIIASYLLGQGSVKMPSEMFTPYDENTYTLMGCITRKLYA